MISLARCRVRCSAWKRTRQAAGRLGLGSRRVGGGQGGEFSTDQGKNKDTTKALVRNEATEGSDDGESKESKKRMDAARHQVEHRVQEKASLKALERVVERVVVKQTVKRGGNHKKTKAGLRLVERTANRASQAAVEFFGEREGQRARGQALSWVETLAEKASGKVLGKRAVARLGRGVLITLPVAGAAFAIFMCRADLLRYRLEKDKLDLYLKAKSAADAGSRGIDTINAAPFFAVAAICDLGDALAHLVIAGALWQDCLPHTAIVQVEYVSVAAAVLSTAAAVGGELQCLRGDRQRREEEEKREQEAEMRKGEGHQTEEVGNTTAAKEDQADAPAAARGCVEKKEPSR